MIEQEQPSSPHPLILYQTMNQVDQSVEFVKPKSSETIAANRREIKEYLIKS